MMVRNKFESLLYNFTLVLVCLFLKRGTDSPKILVSTSS